MNPGSHTPIQLELVDIIEPAAIGHWPLAWGWWLLLIATLVTLGLIIYVTTVMVKQYKIRSRAYRLLDQAKDDYAQSGNANNYCRDVNQILKRYWAYYRPGSDISVLTGKRWVEQLNGHCSTSIFENAIAFALIDGPYSKLDDFNSDELEVAAKQWIKRASIHQLKDTTGDVNV